MYTHPDPQFLAPTWSLEIGQECPVFSACRPDNPIHTLLIWLTFVRLGITWQMPLLSSA